MMAFSADALAGLGRWLGGILGVDIVDLRASKLGGGAIQDNWLIEALVAGQPRAFVLRRDAAATIAASRSRKDEFALIAAAHAAGVTVPTPIGFCDDAAVIGGPFALMGKVDGVGFGPRIVKDRSLGGEREALVERLGTELAGIHAIALPAALSASLGNKPADPALAVIAALRQALDAMGAERPGLEWSLRWAERHAPAPECVVLAHRDFRTGNIMVDQRGLTAILDWEFAGWSDPMEDVGWFCARCWRFSRPDLEAGGLGSRAAFYRGYEAGGGLIDDARVRYWEVVAHLRWAVIALQQGERHASGREPSLEHALTGRIAAELDYAALRMTAPAR